MPALPKLEDVNGLFTMLFGDRTTCKASPAKLPGEQAAVIATYRDNAGQVQRVVACDLGFANSAGASLSMIPCGAASDATKAGQVPDNILANLHEVMNIAVNLFADTFDGRLELADVRRAADVDASLKSAITSGGALAVEVSIPRYTSGRVSLVCL